MGWDRGKTLFAYLSRNLGRQNFYPVSRHRNSGLSFLSPSDAATIRVFFAPKQTHLSPITGMFSIFVASHVFCSSEGGKR